MALSLLRQKPPVSTRERRCGRRDHRGSQLRGACMRALRAWLAMRARSTRNLGLQNQTVRLVNTGAQIIAGPEAQLENGRRRRVGEMLDAGVAGDEEVGV